MAETTAVQKTLNTVVHTELASKDVEATRRFFNKTFHWNFVEQDMPGSDPYIMIKDGQGHDFGGLRTVDKNEPGPSVTNYIGVEDIQATIKSIEQNGGKVIVPVQTIPDMGKMVWFQAPGGIVFACWQDLGGR